MVTAWANTDLPKGVRFAGFYLGFVAFAAISGALAAQFFTLRVTLLVLIAAILIIPIVVRLIQGTYDFLEPLVWVNSALFVMFAVRPYLMHATDDYVFRNSYDVEAEFDWTLVVALVGCLAFQIGYAMKLPKRIGTRISALPVTLVPSTTFLIAVLFVGLAIATQFFGVAQDATTAYFYQLPLLIVPGGLLLLHLARTYGVFGLVPIVYLSILAFSLVLAPAGSRLTLLQIVGAFVVYEMLRIKWRPSAIQLTLMTFVGLVLITSLRDLSGDEGLSGTWESIQSHASDVQGSLTTLFTTEDTEMFSGLALEMSIVPDAMSFQPGSAVQLIFTHSIPRSVWPEKPRAVEDLLNYQLFDVEPGNPGVAYSLLGGFYYDSGLVGVAIGMLLVGIGWSLLWNYLRANWSNPTVQMMFAAMLPFCISLIRGNVQYLAALAIFTVLPFLLIAISMRRKPLTGFDALD